MKIIEIGLLEQIENPRNGIKVIEEKLRKITLNEDDPRQYDYRKKLCKTIKELKRQKQNNIACLQD